MRKFVCRACVTRLHQAGRTPHSSLAHTGILVHSCSPSSTLSHLHHPFRLLSAVPVPVSRNFIRGAAPTPSSQRKGLPWLAEVNTDKSAIGHAW